MIYLEKHFIQSRVSSLKSHEQNLRWLKEHKVKAEKIVNFGCSIGGETLALMWVLDGIEAVGIDKDENAIYQAQNTLTETKREVNRIQRLLEYYPNDVDVSEKSWWDNIVPGFFKLDLKGEYLVQDITRPIKLPTGYFDISCCRFVLNHIWYDEYRKKAKEDTLFAIQEMARVVRHGGIIAMSEPIYLSGKPKLNFPKLFKEVGLELIYESEEEVDGPQGKGIVAEYIIKKVVKT